MKNLLPILLLWCWTTFPLTAQSVSLDTLFFQDGRIEAVQVTMVDTDHVHYHYLGESVRYRTAKADLHRIVFSSGRSERYASPAGALSFEPVNGVTDWKKVRIVDHISQTEGLKRMGTLTATNVVRSVFSGSAQESGAARQMLRQQAAAVGADVVLLNHTQSFFLETSAAGAAYASRLPDAADLLPGEYVPRSGYVLNKNQRHFTGYVHFSRDPLVLTPDDFEARNGLFFLDRPGLIRDNIREHRLLAVNGDTIVLTAVSRDGGKVYNLVLARRAGRQE